MKPSAMPTFFINQPLRSLKRKSDQTLIRIHRLSWNRVLRRPKKNNDHPTRRSVCVFLINFVFYFIFKHNNI